MKITCPQVLFYIGTEAELIKLFPVIQNCLNNKIKINLIFSGQNDVKDTIFLTDEMRSYSIFLLKDKIWFPFKSFSLRALWFIFWAITTFFKTLKMLFQIKVSKKCKPFLVVHGDTISTVIGALAAKIFRLKILHVESGLSSGNVFNPFPEELNRRPVMRLADILFCPTIPSLENAKRFKNKECIDTHGNTMWDMLTYGLTKQTAEIRSPYLLLIIHRQETLATPEIFFKIINIVKLNRPNNLEVLFIMHHPTKGFLMAHNKLNELTRFDKWELIDRLPFYEFINLLKNANFVLTDGGTNQEECYYLGTPCYLLRKCTERNEGIGENVVINNDFLKGLPDFMNNYEMFKKSPKTFNLSPSLLVSKKIEFLCT